MSYKNAIEAGVAFSFLLSACRTVDASKPIDIASPGPTSAPLVEATPTNVILSGETIASTLKGSNISVEIGNMLSSELERIYPGMDEALSSEMRAWEYTRIEMRGDKQDAIFPGDDYVIGVDSVTGRGNMMFIEDSTGVWSLPRAGYQLKQGQVYRSIPMEYVSGANRNAEWRVQSGMSVLVRDRGRWNLALLALDPNTNRQILVPLNVMGGGGKSLFNVLMGTQEPYSGAEVTVNGEAGTIEVGGQVINTPAETKPAPTEGAVDPLAWYSAGPNGEIVGQEGDLCLFGGTEQCFKFASPEVAVEARDGLQRVTLVMWWAESETIRAQYGTFDKFVAAIKEQPVRSDGLLMQPDEQANKDHSLVDGYNPVDPETGEPVEIDYSRYNVRVVDATTAKAEKIVFSQLGGWYSFSQSLIKVPDGKWIVGYTILDHLTLPDSSGYGGLPLNPDLDLGENALAMNQALNFLFTYMRHFENLDSYSTFSGQYPLRLGFFQVSKSAMPNAAKRTSFFVPR